MSIVVRSVVILTIYFLAGVHTVAAQVPCLSEGIEVSNLTSSTIDSLIDQCMNHRIKIEDKLKSYAEQIICYGRINSDQARFGRGCFFLGMHHYFNSSMDSALHQLFLAHDLARSLEDRNLLAWSANFLALSYRTLGHYDVALAYQQEFYEYGRSIGDRHMQGGAMTNLGALYQDAGDYEKSRECQLNALKFFENGPYGVKAEESLLWLYRSLALNYQQEGEIDNAIFYYEQALNIGKELDFTRGTLWSLISLIEFYGNRNLDIAQSYLSQANELLKTLDNVHIESSLLYHSGIIEKERGNSIKALSTLEEALELAGTGDYRVLVLAILNTLLEVSRENDLEAKEISYLRILESNMSENVVDFRSESIALWAESQNKIVNQQKENLKLKEAEYAQTKTLQNQRAVIIGIFLALMILGIYLYATRKISKRTEEHNKILLEKSTDIAVQLEIIGQQKEELESANKVIQVERSKLKNELAQKMIHIANEQEMLSNLSKLLEDIDISKDGKTKINKYLQRHNRETIWEDFDQEISSSNEMFFAKLAKVSPKLTSNDFRLAAMIKMNLDNKEIARLLFRSVESIHMAKSRLRKKLNLNKESMNLVAYFNYIMNENDISNEESV